MQYSYLCRLIVEQKSQLLYRLFQCLKKFIVGIKKPADILIYLKFHLMSYDEEIQNKYIKNLMMVN